MQQIKLEDYLLCYLTGVSRFIGVLEVTSEPYWDEMKVSTREAELVEHVCFVEICRVKRKRAWKDSNLRHRV